MFTFGIFSTHIPYIAFVVFYVYFLLTGVNKAVSGEIPPGENYTKTELFATEIFDQQKPDTFHHYAEISNAVILNHFEELLFKRKIRYPVFTFAKTSNDHFSYSQFNRPPPVV